MKHKIWLLAAMLMLALGQVSAAEKITYYHLDALGSPIAATDENGNLAWKEAYKPYGERIRKEDGGSNSTWYTGKQEDADNGLTYFGARWYDPSIGRFMGIDSVAVQEDNVHSFNRFAYANNNPYKFVDPDWREPVGVGVPGLPSPAWHPVFREGNIVNDAYKDSMSRMINATAETINNVGKTIELTNKLSSEGSSVVGAVASVIILYNNNSGNDDYTGHGENPEGKTGTGGNWNKHSEKRAGKRYGGNRNKKRGNKNKKYQKPKNKNK